MFERHGIDILAQNAWAGGWRKCAELLDPLYQLMKKELLGSKVIGTDDTSVKVLDRKLSFAQDRTDLAVCRGDTHHPVIWFTDYTPTRAPCRPGQVSGRI